MVAGTLSFLSAVTPDVPWRKSLVLAVEPGPVIGFEHVLTAVLGLALIYLGWSTFRGRRRAVNVLIVLLLALAAVNVAKGLDYEESGVALALAAVLFANRRAFVRGGAATRGLIAATVAVGAVALAYAVDVGFLLISNRARGFGSALAGAATALGEGAWWLRSGEPIAIVLDALLITAVLATAVFLRALMRPARAADGHTAGDHYRAAEIVARHGSDSLDPFALREEKAFFFSRGGMLAYRTLRETAVVSGDPIGPPGTAAGIAGDFLLFASERGWDVVFTAVSQRFLDDYRGLGLRTMCIGEEAAVDPAGFTLEGRAIRKVRQSVTRAERRGWSVEIVDGVQPHSPLAAELAAVEAHWRAARKRNHGFAMSLGRLWGSPEDAHAVYALGREPDGSLGAFVRFARTGHVLSLDVMRRLGDEPNGLNEALVARTLEWAREHDIAEVSLNFAGFAHVMASRASLSGSQRLLRLAIGRVHGRFQLERLTTFNNKFKPLWRPRYLVFGTRTHLPLAALRVLQAEAYIRPPRTTSRPACWKPVADVSSHPVADVPDRALVRAQPGATR
jgi:lysyl-tRNA synthetase class 2